MKDHTAGLCRHAAPTSRPWLWERDTDPIRRGQTVRADEARLIVRVMTKRDERSEENKRYCAARYKAARQLERLKAEVMGEVTL